MPWKTKWIAAEGGERKYDNRAEQWEKKQRIKLKRLKLKRGAQN